MSTVNSDLDVPGGATRPPPGATETTPPRLAPAGDLAVLSLLGGEPVGETLLMWWNFVGRTPDDIAVAARDWATGQRFGQVAGYRSAPLPASPLNPAYLARKAG